MVLLASMIFVFLNAYIETCKSQIADIDDDESATANQYPFIAYIVIRTEWGISDWCAGSLLRKESPAVILTGARCADSAIIDPKTYVVLHGDIRNDPNGIKKAASSIKIHPNYDWLDYDIALLFINEDLTQYSELSTVNIVPLSSDTSECCNTGDDLTTIGYGIDTPTLEHEYLDYLSRSECQNGTSGRFRPGGSGRYEPGEITNEMICAYDISNDEGPCHGDLGGPLVKKGGNEQIGIVSWAYEECGSYPYVYTNIGIPSIYNWIQTELAYTKTPTTQPTQSALF